MAACVRDDRCAAKPPGNRQQVGVNLTAIPKEQ
jgi:hypothetical protein